MSFTLKTYQQDCLDRLSAFLKKTAAVGAANAFNLMPDLPVKYRAVPGWAKCEQLPYVCLRVPTGGGKTIIGACATGVVRRELLGTEHCVVLWLAPTGQIVDQTIKALRKKDHPYRLALEQAAAGPVTILDIQEALYVTRGTLDGSTTVIVSTIQSLRVEDTDNRKVYEQAGALQHHFDAPFAELQKTLAEVPDVAVYSLAHVLRSRRPVVIMDEAHNARSELTFDFLQRLDPSAIIEFTATPDQDKSPSNVLYSVTAARLKEADMIKLPIRLVARPQWKEAVQAAKGKREELEARAGEERKVTGEYIRPIVLMQAQAKSAHGEPVTVDVLRKALIEDFGIPEDHIARATGEDGPLPDDILEETSKIRYVLTVQKLREGWDCPFAYVLCSASNLSSRTAVEQTLGRILRMPKATLKKCPDLNQAYAFVTSEDFEATAKNLTDTLVDTMGFSKFEAKQAVEKQAEIPFEGGGGGLWAKEFTEKVEEKPAITALTPELAAKVTFDATAGTLTYAGTAMPVEELTALEGVFKTEEAKVAVRKIFQRSWNQPTDPAALGRKFAVPILCLKVGSQVALFEDQHHNAPWKLADRSAALSAEDFTPSAGMSRVGVVDVTKAGDMTYTAGEVQYLKELRGQMLLHEARGPKTMPQLVAWLDRAIYNQWVTPGDKAQFLTRVVRHLLEVRSIALEDVLASRFTLVDRAAELIERHRKEAATSQYNMLLLPDAATPIVVDPKVAFRFPLTQYPAPSIYTGGLTFKKHYYKAPAEMNGDEAKCAAEIDRSDAVEYWVRNLTRHDCSFWLQTSTDKFYPDFVALRKDGRVVAVEFKAFKDVSNDDSKEKKAIGEVWAARSGGACRFAMVTEKDFQTVVPALLST
jgi:type III restriction enzyme